MIFGSVHFEICVEKDHERNSTTFITMNVNKCCLQLKMYVSRVDVAEKK